MRDLVEVPEGYLEDSRGIRENTSAVEQRVLFQRPRDVQQSSPNVHGFGTATDQSKADRFHFLKAGLGHVISFSEETCFLCAKDCDVSEKKETEKMEEEKKKNDWIFLNSKKK